MPLYRLTSGGLEVNSDYYFPMESPYANIQKSYLRTLADHLTRTHRKLNEICEFVERCEEHSQLMLPTLITVLCDWVKQFLRDHACHLDELRAERLEDPLQTLARLNKNMEEVEIVRAVIGDDVGRHIWLWEDIENSWNRVFLLTQMDAIAKKRDVVKLLQNKWIRALLSIMDHIFEIGRVPAAIDYFVLHNDVKPDAQILLCRDIKEVQSLLWDEELIEIILEAVKCRIRVGLIEFPVKTFTNAFDSLRAAAKFTEDLLPFDEFRSLFFDTCLLLQDQFAQELLNELHRNNRFVNLWVDLENVVIGSISQQYATTVFRSDSNVTNFADAFWLASRGRMSKENMNIFSWISTKSEFTCKLEHMLASFIRPEVIDVMNQCMKFAHSAYRTRELLVTMANDKELLSRMKCPQSTIDVSLAHHKTNAIEKMNRALRTKLRFFVFTLEQVVSHFRELFSDKVRYVFRTARDQIVNATSLKQVENAITDGHKKLSDLVVRIGIRRLVHENMDMFMTMTDEIRLRSVSNTLDLDYLDRCETSVRITLQKLLSLHEAWGNDKDSIFFHLSVRIGKLNMGT